MKLDLKKAGRKIKTGWNKNNQAILALVAGACAIGAVVEAIRKAPVAVEIKNKREENINNLSEKLKASEIDTAEFNKLRTAENWRTAKEYALCYGTTTALLLLSVGSTACGYKISIGKQAALVGAYKMLESKSDEFKSKVKEVVGEKKFDEIKNEIVKDHISKTDIPDTIKAPQYDTDDNGNYIAKQYLYPCWEDLSGRPFMSSVSNIDVAMRKASAYCYSNNEITLNKIYEYLDPNGRELPPNSFGETHGFLASDLDGEKMLHYHTRAVDVGDYDHSFTALIFDSEPVNLVIDSDY